MYRQRYYENTFDGVIVEHLIRYQHYAVLRIYIVFIH